MQASETVTAMATSDDAAARVRRVLADGVDALLTDATTRTAIDYDSKLRCISEIGALANAAGVRRKQRDGLALCLDEMLMNAIYDAPAGEPARDAIVRSACDGVRFTVAVRDAFGTLSRDTVLRYLHKCLHSADPIDHKQGGAGLGLYMMVNSASEVYFEVRPGVSTEVACVFEVAAKRVVLDGFGIFVRGTSGDG